ncbi:gene transfer agent family protein [Marinicaulis aureus]|uniref:Gene transfer agent family protein n=1 Tax=Hyphococcus aureus TaxID=2666033 RepID=A0ABW1KVB1_9PROT
MTHPRGDVSIRINGEEKTLRLTLGALADIEEKLGQGDLSSLQARLKQPRIADIVLILHALLAGGGATLTMEALKASDLDLAQAARAIAQAFESLGGDEPPGKSASGEG